MERFVVNADFDAVEAEVTLNLKLRVWIVLMSVPHDVIDGFIGGENDGVGSPFVEAGHLANRFDKGRANGSRFKSLAKVRFQGAAAIPSLPGVRRRHAEEIVWIIDVKENPHKAGSSVPRGSCDRQGELGVQTRQLQQARRRCGSNGGYSVKPRWRAKVAVSLQRPVFQNRDRKGARMSHETVPLPYGRGSEGHYV